MSALHVVTPGSHGASSTQGIARNALRSWFHLISDPGKRIGKDWPNPAAPDCTKMAGQIIALVNAHRITQGCSRLRNNMPLRGSARWKSSHMAYYAYMAHDDPAPPVARTVFQRIDAFLGQPNAAAGENIAYGFVTAKGVFDAWMSDYGHRANIENPSWTDIGIGVALRPAGKAADGSPMEALYFFTMDTAALAA